VPTVLVVDDEPDVRLVARLVLTSAGYGVVEAANGEDALAALERDPPDLVLLDVRMPGLDGWEVLRRARAEPATSTVPVVVFTADASAVDEAEGRLGTDDSLITKPFKPDRLVDAVRAAIGSADGAQADGGQAGAGTLP
jgi:CheY-like chemotaxis protein